jgi:hypothetical protein
MTEFAMQLAPIPAAPVFDPTVLLIPPGCFIVALLLLRHSARKSWLTSIAVSLAVTTIPLFFVGAYILTHTGLSQGTMLAIILLPAAISAMILIIQFFRWLLTAETVQPAVNTAERSKILKLIQDRKISSNEGKELLDAMGRSNAPGGQGGLSRLDKTILAAAALVIVGFFLPWAYIARGGYQAGYHRGPLGWSVLIVALLSTVPVFVTPIKLLYKIAMLRIFLILAGLAIMIKELITIKNNLGAGLVLCGIGLLLALISSGFKLKTLRT